MTFEKLEEMFTKHNIPKNARLMNDSGWECDATDMNCIYYNRLRNIIVFEDEFYKYSYYNKDIIWELIYEGEEII